MPMPQQADALVRKLTVPLRVRSAAVTPASYSAEDNSIEVVWSTGAAVTRFDWYDGEYYDETLSLEAGAVRLDRLNAGAPFLDSHDDWTLAAVLGSVVPGTARIEGGKGIARVSLSSAADVADQVTKIREGHVRNVSVGYAVHEYEVIEGASSDSGRKEMRAVDWEPMEISAVAIPADPGAQVRARPDPQGGFPCIVRGLAAPQDQENDMPQAVTDPAVQEEPVVTDPVQPAQAPQPAQQAGGGERHATIDMIVQRTKALGAEFTVSLMTRHGQTPLTEMALLEAVTAEYATRAGAQQPIDNSSTARVLTDETEKYRKALTAAFVARINDSRETPADGGELFGSMSSIEIARASLERQGIRTSAMGRRELASVALGLHQRGGAMTTTDFSIALQQAGNLAIMKAYDQAEDTWRVLAKETSAPDFRPVNLAGLVGTPAFLVVEENGEYTYGSFSDIGASYKLWTAGKIIALSRQLIIDDQLNFFGDMAVKLGEGAALHEANSAWAVILGNPTLSDGIPLFHASHGNLADAGSAISVASLGAARAAMRKQVDRDGITPLNIVPKYLVCGPDKETEAASVLMPIVASQVANVNPFVGSLTLSVDPRIVGNAWYVFADPARAPVLQVSYLQGERGIYTDERIAFERDAIEYKGRIDFAASPYDYRGAYKNPGN